LLQIYFDINIVKNKDSKVAFQLTLGLALRTEIYVSDPLMLRTENHVRQFTRTIPV